METKKLKSKQKTNGEKKVMKVKPLDETKFETYFDFKIPVKFVKPHQVPIYSLSYNFISYNFTTTVIYY